VTGREGGSETQLAECRIETSGRETRGESQTWKHI